MIALALAGCTPDPSPTETQSVDDTPVPPGIEELARLDRLARFKRSERVGMFSSYDRTGGNDDGFSGTHSFLREEPEGLVLAELDDGPGAVYRIWTPTPTDDTLAFYFDGEAEPRLEIPFRQLFTGERAPFLEPLVGHGGGGFYSYLPILFERSLKIVARAEQIQFYQVNYAIYPEGTDVRTYDGYEAADARAALEQAIDVLGSTGENLSALVAPPGAPVRTEVHSLSLDAGSTATLFETDEPGRIVGLRLSPASAFAGKARDVVLRIYWDGDAAPAVVSPVGDLFGYAWGEPAMRALVAGTDGDTNYLYLPMPFDRSARIELHSERAIEVRAEVDWSAVPRRADEGHFYALWRRENPTTIGEPFAFLDTEGRGHVVGAILQAQGFEPPGTGFFEGDDQATLDGELVAHGTGSEDFFNGGWYDVTGRWQSRVSLPLSGCLGYSSPLSRTGGYRFLLTDAYPYERRASLTIEHSPTDNSFATDYTGVTFLYSQARPDLRVGSWTELLPVDERRVEDPDRIVFRPGWSVPIDSFSFRDMTLAKSFEEIEGKRVPVLHVRARDTDIFGPHSIAFRFDLPEAGRYAVSLEALGGPDQAIVQIDRDESPRGEAVDLYRPRRELTGPIVLAELDFDEGENVVLLKLTGKNPDSSSLGLDLTAITFERLP